MKMLCSLAAGLALPLPALAQYSASVVGLGPGNIETPSLQVNPGETFSGAVVITGPAGIRNDSAVFRLAFNQPGLLYAPGWYQWGNPYVTGGPDDLTAPLATATGVIGPGTYNDPANPGAIDIGFENATPAFGTFFQTGQLVRFTFQIAANAGPGIFEIAFADGSFTNGTASVGASAGASLLVTVIPAPGPAAAMLVLLGAAARRRRSA
ncbi:MAG: hypothetical protein IBJ11_09235 [Phycisphaerales bacterium]|nr:hypothetical protein [Phycisphaerales bacterium]